MRLQDRLIMAKQVNCNGNWSKMLIDGKYMVCDGKEKYVE